MFAPTPSAIVLGIFIWHAFYQVETGRFYYKSLENKEEDKNGEGIFLDNEFFECNRAQNCTHVVKMKNSIVFAVVHGKSELKKESDYDVIYEKIEVQQQDCIDNRTNPTPSDGKLFSLDKQQVKCHPFGLLRRFQLQQNATGILYEHACCKFRNIACNMVSRVTQWNDDGEGRSMFLDRHTVDCGESSLLHSFVLERDATLKQIRYLYSCCDVLNPVWEIEVKCQENGNVFMNEGNKSVFILALQNVSCDPGSALSKFVYSRDIREYFRYEYKCCKINT